MFGFGMEKSDIDCPAARQLVAEGAQLVDVRSPMEFAQGALPGSINLPVQNIQAARGQLDTAKPVILYCRSGARSSQAQMMLRSMGFAEVHNLGPITKYLSC